MPDKKTIKSINASRNQEVIAPKIVTNVELTANPKIIRTW